MSEKCVMCGHEIPEGQQVCYNCQEAYGKPETGITMREYQQLAMRTAPEYKSDNDAVLNAALGLAGEAGEFADAIKKALFQGHAMNHDNLIEEVGDLLWYCALAARALRVPLDIIASGNVDKLKRRYPSGFDAWHSMNRQK